MIKPGFPIAQSIKRQTALLLSEKQGSFSDRNTLEQTVADIEDRIKRRIQSSGRGAIFTPAQFLDLGSRSAVDKALSRLAAKGSVRRLARGLYDYPKRHPVMGELQPEPEAVAKLLAQRDSVRLQPAGAYAANLLGLSEQVPARIVFLTDGPSRTVRIGPTEITLRKTASRNMATAGRISGLLAQALKYLGKNAVTGEQIAHLRRAIPPKERASLVRDLRYVPVWMHPIFRNLAESSV